MEEILNALKNQKVLFYDSTDNKDVFNIDGITADSANGYQLKFSNEQQHGCKSLTEVQVRQLFEDGKSVEMSLLNCDDETNEKENVLNSYLGHFICVTWKEHSTDDEDQVTLGTLIRCKHGLLTIASTYRPFIYKFPIDAENDVIKAELEKCGIRNTIIPLKSILHVMHLAPTDTIIGVPLL